MQTELDLCRQRTEEHPRSATAHFNLGLAYTHRGMAGRAEQAYRCALEIDPDLVEAWVNLGGALMLQWDFKGCLEANREALKRKEDLVLAHYNTCQACLYLGDAEGVVRSSRRVLELDSTHAAGCYYQAVGLLAVGQVAEARDAVAQAKALGHSPAPDFLRALMKAEEEQNQEQDETTTTNAGADAP